MKWTLIIFPLLIIAINSMQYISQDILTTLSTSSSYFYIFASAYSFYGEVYLYFKDVNYHLRTVKVCYSDSVPSNPASSCSFYEINYYEKRTSSSADQYFYKFSTKSTYGEKRTYIIVQYQGSNTYGSLYVEASDNDLYKTVEEIVDTVLSTIAIVFIVIGSIIGLAIIITVIVFVILCTRRKTIQGSAGYIQPPSIVVTNPVTYPTYPVAQTPNYQYAKPV